MNLIPRFGWSLLLFSTIFGNFSSHAGLFENELNLSASQIKAQTLSEQIPTGRIVVMSVEGSKVRDYATGTVIGRPNETRTQSVLSCAHTYHAWNQPENIFHFIDHQGQKHIIDRVEPCSNKLLDAPNDIALYRLKDPIPCNPNIKIAREVVNEAQLSSLTYGWTLATNQPLSFCNINPVLPYYLENALQFYDNFYATPYEAIQIFSIEERYKMTYSYIPTFSPDKPFVSPFFRHDSGSAWFSGNEKDGYILSALSSEMAKVELSDIESEITNDAESKLTIDKDQEYTFQYYKMKQAQTYWNYYAPLAPHWDWIQDRI